jgi:hypothetical protein
VKLKSDELVDDHGQGQVHTILRADPSRGSGHPARRSGTTLAITAISMANSDLFVRSASWLAALAKAGGDHVRGDRYVVAVVGWYERSGGAVVSDPTRPRPSARG